MGVGACVRRWIIWIKGAGALFLQVAVDVLAARCQVDAVEIEFAASLDTLAKARARADLIRGAMLVEVTGNATVHAAPIFAGEPGHTIEARVATWCGLDAALAFPGDVDALAAVLAVRGALARTAAREHALFDRCPIEIVTAGFDAHQASSAIAGGVA